MNNNNCTGRILYRNICVLLLVLFVVISRLSAEKFTLAQNKIQKNQLPSRKNEISKNIKSSKSENTNSKQNFNKDISPITDKNKEIQHLKNLDNWIFEIYRCPECGYEQDEPGYCPDHINTKLVKVDNLEQILFQPNELDGYEDIIVDIPLETIKPRNEDDKKVSSTNLQSDGEVDVK